MASAIDRVAASRLIASHRSLISDLVAANNEYQSLRSEVKQASDALATQEVLQVLKGVSIDEINREKKGFRVKTLREHGYHTIADIATASVHTLASIHGISEDSAYEIRRTVNAIIEASRQGVKIKLSEDNKSKVATRVIVAVSKLRKKEQHYRECSSLLKNAQANIENAIIDLSPATSGLRWLFTSKKKKSYRLIENIKVDYYGTRTPINQTSNINVQDARMLIVSPWDVSTLKSIKTGIEAANLGVSVSDDGKIIRVGFPMLTEERRRDLVKQTKKLVEDTKVVCRNARRDAIEELKKLKKDSLITEDEQATYEKEVQKRLDETSVKIDKMMDEKEKEIMQV